MASYQRHKTRESSHVTTEVTGCQFVFTSNDLFTVVMQDHIPIIILYLVLISLFLYLFVQLCSSLDHAHMLQVHVVVPPSPTDGHFYFRLDDKAYQYQQTSILHFRCLSHLLYDPQLVLSIAPLLSAPPLLLIASGQLIFFVLILKSLTWPYVQNSEALFYSTDSHA